ncbi:MAG: NAD(P)-dependent oxidoreductase [Chitinophagales bacterium]
MNNNQKIAVIGGTGKSGKYLVQQLLNQGFPIKLLLRNPERFQIKNSLIEIVPGIVQDYQAIHTLVEGCCAVISALGLGQHNSEKTIFSRATTNVIRALNTFQIKRYILITGLNVDTPFDKKGTHTTFATEWMKANYPETTADKQKEWEMLSESALDWTLVRLPLIELTDEIKELKVSLEDCPGEKISATDLAYFMVRQLSENDYLGKSPFIASM